MYAFGVSLLGEKMFRRIFWQQFFPKVIFFFDVLPSVVDSKIYTLLFFNNGDICSTAAFKNDKSGS